MRKEKWMDRQYGEQGGGGREGERGGEKMRRKQAEKET